MTATGSPSGMAETASRAYNKAEADRVLRAWADELRKHLDAAQKSTATP